MTKYADFSNCCQRVWQRAIEWGRGMSNVKSQIQRFKEAARESGADMSKDEFARVIGGLAKPKPQPQAQPPDKDQEAEDAS